MALALPSITSANKDNSNNTLQSTSTFPNAGQSSAGATSNRLMGNGHQASSDTEDESRVLNSANTDGGTGGIYPGPTDNQLSADDLRDMFGEDESGDVLSEADSDPPTGGACGASTFGAKAEKQRQEDATDDDLERALELALAEDATADDPTITSPNRSAEMKAPSTDKEVLDALFSKSAAPMVPAPSATRVAIDDAKAEKLAKRQQARQSAVKAGASGLDSLMAKNTAAKYSPKGTTGVEQSSNDQTPLITPPRRKTELEFVTDYVNRTHRGGDDMPPLGSKHLDETKTDVQMAQELIDSGNQPDLVDEDAGEDSEDDEPVKEDTPAVQNAEDGCDSVFEICRSRLNTYEGVEVAEYSGEEQIQKVLYSVMFNNPRMIVFKHPDGHTELLISDVSTKDGTNKANEESTPTGPEITQKGLNTPAALPTPASSTAATPACNRSEDDGNTEREMNEVTPSKPPTKKKKITSTGPERSTTTPKKAKKDAAAADIGGPFTVGKRKRVLDDDEKSNDEHNAPLMKKTRKEQNVSGDSRRTVKEDVGAQSVAPTIPSKIDAIEPTEEDLRNAALGLRKPKPIPATIDQNVDNDDAGAGPKSRKRQVKQATGTTRGKKTTIARADPKGASESNAGSPLASTSSKKRGRDENEDEPDSTGPTKKRGKKA